MFHNQEYIKNILNSKFVYITCAIFLNSEHNKGFIISSRKHLDVNRQNGWKLTDIMWVSPQCRLGAIFLVYHRNVLYTFSDSPFSSYTEMFCRQPSHFIHCCCCCCCVTLVVSNSVWPHRWQSTRVPRPWDSPGKNTKVGCHFLLQYYIDRIQ